MNGYVIELNQTGVYTTEVIYCFTMHAVIINMMTDTNYICPSNSTISSIENPIIQAYQALSTVNFAKSLKKFISRNLSLFQTKMCIP